MLVKHFNIVFQSDNNSHAHDKSFHTFQFPFVIIEDAEERYRPIFKEFSPITEKMQIYRELYPAGY